jgi:NDP-sugar pyrophosphorylase family protein
MTTRNRGEFPIKLGTAVVLAGGPGVRLKPLTDRVPKALVEVAGKPLIQWVIEWLRMNDVRRIVLGVAHLKEEIMNYLEDGSRFDVEITYSTHTVDGGTSEGFRLAISRYVRDDVFFAMNGDQITDLKLGDLEDFHIRYNPVATITVTHPHCPYGHIKFDENHDVLGFTEKPFCPHAECNTGFYVFKKEIVNYLPHKGDVEKTTFPLLAAEKNLKVYPFNGIFITVNTHKDLVEAEEKLKVIYR